MSLLVNRVGDLGTDKANSIFFTSSFTRKSPRPLCLVKGLEEEENSQQ